MQTVIKMYSFLWCLCVSIQFACFVRHGCNAQQQHSKVGSTLLVATAIVLFYMDVKDILGTPRVSKLENCERCDCATG